MSSNIKRILQVLERWPLDPNKFGRDLGQYLRDSVQKAHKEGKVRTDVQYWDRQYLSLRKLVDNDHKQKYPRLLQSTATGLTAEQCNLALSNEFLKYLEEEDQSVFKKAYSKFCMLRQAMESAQPHIPVMATEVINYLNPQQKQVILDMTFGAGGHSRKILRNNPNIKLLALDRDPCAQQYMNQLSSEYPNQVIPLTGKFSDLPQLLKQHNVYQNSIDGMLFDFGCSSMQFDVANRGFSVSKNGPLDMRMDGYRLPDAPTASDVLSSATEEDLYKIIKYYGEEKQARKIARAIVEARYLFKKLLTTEELADLVNSVFTKEGGLDKLDRHAHNATKTFQALRIFVNNELNEINYGLVLAQKYLKIGGRLITISFHSLEDTIVKRHMAGNILENSANPLPLKYSSHTLSLDKSVVEELMESNWKMLHKHVIVPRYDEVEVNPRSRSAKLRAAVRIR